MASVRNPENYARAGNTNDSREKSVVRPAIRIAADAAVGYSSASQFQENRQVDIVKGNMGWIEVIVGPMFSGKSEELIRRLRRAEIGKQRVQIFKPIIDQRYSKNGIVSHSGLEIASDLVRNGDEILDKVAARTEVVG